MKQTSQPTAPPSRQPTRALGKPAQDDIRTPRQVRTLIADDSPFGLKALARILLIEGNFPLVGTATDGCQAVRQAFILQPELILMDYDMPHMDGIEARRFIKQFKNPPLVIIVTSNNTPECRALAKAAGADGFVDKGGDLHGQLRMVFQELLRAVSGTIPCQEVSRSQRPRGCV